MSITTFDSVPRAVAHALKQRNSVGKNPSDLLDLSESLTYDSAVEILGAYKLTGNFAIDLEIVLKDLEVFDKVRFEIKPKSLLSSCRKVEFRRAYSVSEAEFIEIKRRINNRIGFDFRRSWWAKLFQ